MNLLKWFSELFSIMEKRSAPPPVLTVSPYLRWRDGEVDHLKDLMARGITHEHAMWESEMTQNFNREYNNQIPWNPWPGWGGTNQNLFAQLSGQPRYVNQRFWENGNLMGRCPCCGRSYY